jgi:hypothetical protein
MMQRRIWDGALEGNFFGKGTFGVWQGRGFEDGGWRG